MNNFPVLFLLAVSAHLGFSAPPGLLRNEFIFETAPFPECHASTIIQTKAGLLASWFGGTREKNPDVVIWVSNYQDGKWSAPRQVADGIHSSAQRFPCWNPVLFQPRGGPLALFYKVGPSPTTWWGMVITSTDQGVSWSVPQRLPEGILGPIKNKPVQLGNGDILSPSSTEQDGWRVHFERSQDNGKTWKKTEPVNDKKEFGAIQPSILLHPNGKIQAIGRTEQGKIFQIWSEDRGQTWDQMRVLNLPNPNSGLDAVTLLDGRHLVVYNHTSKGRSPLNVAVSRDGLQWSAALVLEDEKGEFSYPAVIQTTDGLIHVSYTWKRKRIKHAVLDPAALVLREMVAGRWPQ